VLDAQILSKKRVNPIPNQSYLIPTLSLPII
jgi:hypothetical protein